MAEIWQTMSLHDTRIDLWRINLAASDKALAVAAGVLNRQEHHRAARFHLEQQRTRFILARAALRSTLSHYLHKPPEAIQLTFNAQGKATLADPQQAGDWHFNLAHTRNQALIAVAQGARVGVDLEYINLQRPGVLDLAQYFSAPACTALAALPPAQQMPAFYRCWVRKEAFAQALGRAIPGGLDQFALEFSPDQARFLAIDPAVGGPQDWALFDLDFGDYAAALVVENQRVQDAAC